MSLILTASAPLQLRYYQNMFLNTRPYIFFAQGQLSASEGSILVIRRCTQCA